MQANGCRHRVCICYWVRLSPPAVAPEGGESGEFNTFSCRRRASYGTFLFRPGSPTSCQIASVVSSLGVARSAHVQPGQATVVLAGDPTLPATHAAEQKNAASRLSCPRSQAVPCTGNDHAAGNPFSSRRCPHALSGPESGWGFMRVPKSPPPVGTCMTLFPQESCAAIISTTSFPPMPCGNPDSPDTIRYQKAPARERGVEPGKAGIARTTARDGTHFEIRLPSPRPQTEASTFNADIRTVDDKGAEDIGCHASQC
ncbi:hypothetical protein VTI74DRAFT_4076 [Chaetomium olivicolor]